MQFGQVTFVANIPTYMLNYLKTDINKKYWDKGLHISL